MIVIFMKMRKSADGRNPSKYTNEAALNVNIVTAARAMNNMMKLSYVNHCINVMVLTKITI